ncbi:MutS-related protein [Undibacterium sp. TJN19]|uniref:MutS-related protein n=1 Tax=Undibacterium sp. TJN19 TaxID=3413055 RepID=UPI003BF3786A
MFHLNILQKIWRRFIARLVILSPLVGRAPLDFPFALSDIAQLYRSTLAEDTPVTDEQTAADLLLDDYAASLTRGSSIFAQQLVHKRLRAGAGSNDSPSRIAALLQDTALQQSLTQQCHLLRQVDTEISATLFAGDVPVPRKNPERGDWVLRMLPLLMLSLIGLAFAVSAYLWTGVLLVWIVLMLIQMHYHEVAADWARKMQALQMLLITFNSLGGVEHSEAAICKAGRQQANKVIRGIRRSNVTLQPALRDYADWLMLDNVRHYFKSSTVVRDNLEFLREAFLLVASLETDLAIARHLQGQAQYCWATPAAKKQLKMEQVVHPLLEKSIPLNMALDGKGAFISGQNGIGKSTLLRTVGLNLITARAFGFCYARTAALPALQVYASMQSEDSLMGGESLYLSELRRAKELLEFSRQGHDALFIIDEIFRGTNHLESVSAAAAVLHTLCQTQMVIVSSHNLALAPLLNTCLQPYCVTRLVDEQHLQLLPGVLDKTNGIALLATHGFGSELDRKARRVYDWLDSYMAHPAECEDLLDT